MLHKVQYRRVHVAAVAWHEEGGDLPRALREKFVPAGPASKNYENRAGLVPFAYQILTCGNLPWFAARRLEKADVINGERREPFQLIDKCIGHTVASEQDCVLPMRGCTDTR
jgi:hypothetical protein